MAYFAETEFSYGIGDGAAMNKKIIIVQKVLCMKFPERNWREHCKNAGKNMGLCPAAETVCS